MSWLSQTWSAVWPNLLASALWSPLMLIHITRSNRKHGFKVEVGLPEDEDGLDTGAGDHLPGQ